MPITDQVLAVVSIAPPVALAVYAGWFRPAARGEHRRVRGAQHRALLGAWLGYHVPHAPGLGAVTAIVAATLAANLGLIAFDVSTRPSGGDRRRAGRRARSGGVRRCLSVGSSHEPEGARASGPLPS